MREDPEARMADSNFVQCPVCRARHLPTEGSLENGVYASTCQNCGHFFKFKATGPIKSSVSFTVNGTPYTVGNEYPAALSLNEFLRTTGASYGTKQMCIEGGCGVCLVTTTLYDPLTKSVQTYSVNSCLLPLYCCDGMQVTTVEGLGNPRDGLHPIQERLAQYNGSQCGFCSPGQVMNMYGLLKRNPKPTMQEVENEFDAVICRCTGYRSILDAMKSFSPSAPSTLPGGPIDIEELDKKICSKTGEKCTGRCSGTENKQIPLHLVLKGAQWFKPTTRQELFSILQQHQSDVYRLVLGNSGFGVYKEIGPWMYNVLIDLRGIQELGTIDVTSGSYALFGANITLTNLLETFMNNSTNPKYPYFRDFATTLSDVANVGVRNLGSWAGNLMLKHLHPEFPSDVFTLFEAVNATISVCDVTGAQTDYTLTQFLALNMKGKTIFTLKLPSFSTGDVFVRTFKVSPRHQNSHAYVNAGFKMQIDVNNNFTVKTKPNIVYGGINRTLIHASATETYLVGKQLGDPNVLKGAITSLATELVPDTSPGLSSPAYRKNLAITLFYKYVLGICGQRAKASYRSGSTNLMRPVSSGQQTYGTHKNEWPLTQPLTKRMATVQTSGRTQFIDDIPPQPTELHAAFVLATEGNAEINSVDTSTAMSLPGVVKYLSAADVPTGGVNNYMPGTNAPQEVFSSGKIYYHGQPIGLIVADDPLTASTAASLVKVTYKNVQPPILTIDDAIQKGSMFPNVAKEFKVGDAAGAISRSDKTASGTLSAGHQYHFFLETQRTVCYPTEDEVGLKILTATQCEDYEIMSVAQVLNIPQNKIDIEVRQMGGGFGGKQYGCLHTACACALAAYILRRPVRHVLDVHTNIKTGPKRFPYQIRYQVGFTNAGLLNGIKMTLYANCGITPNNNVLPFIPVWLDNVYHCPNWDYIPVAVKTNLPANTYCRGPGSVPAIFFMESVMEHVARALNMDPLTVKKLNMYNKGQTSMFGMPLVYCDIKSMVAQLEASANVQTRKQQVAAFNQANRWKKKGLSVQPLRWFLRYTGARYNNFVTIYHGDGSVALSIGGVEVGQGINVKMMQVCAYELGIPIDLVTVKPTTTFVDGNSSSTGGSKTSEANALGIMNCCQALKTRMAPVKAKMPTATWQQLVAACYNQGMDLSAHYYTFPTDSGSAYNVYGVACTEVELDVLTGENQICRVDILYDCGESMNPEIDIGQAEGAFVMGLGYWLTEQMLFDSTNGANLSDGTWEYKPPLGKDIPIDFRIQFMKNHPNQRGVLRSKGVGEPPLCLASSALFAIKHAIEAARKDASKDTFFPLSGPATVEAIHTATQVDASQLVYGN